MNIYHCMIEIKDDARARGFAAAVEDWMSYLKSQNLISDWRLLRRKFGLAAGPHSDFLLEININSLADLDSVFSALSQVDAETEARYDKVHQMIASLHSGLYRSYPDPSQRERIALI